jgi:hypothetical protein
VYLIYKLYLIYMKIYVYMAYQYPVSGILGILPFISVRISYTIINYIPFPPPILPIFLIRKFDYFTSKVSTDKKRFTHIVLIYIFCIFKSSFFHYSLLQYLGEDVFSVSFQFPSTGPSSPPPHTIIS